MCCGDFVIAEGADEEKIAEIRPTQQVFHEVQRCRIEPLQVIEEERQGMFRPSKNPDELPKHELKAPLRVLRRKFRNGWWLSDDELQFRNETDNQSCVRP